MWKSILVILKGGESMSESPNRAHSRIDDERNDLPVPGTSWYANCQVRKPCAYTRVFHAHTPCARTCIACPECGARTTTWPSTSFKSRLLLSLPPLHQLCGQLTFFPGIESPRAEAINFLRNRRSLTYK